MKKLVYLSILISTIAIYMGPTHIHAANYYVDANKGNDNNIGTSKAPWKTLTKANSILKAGDTAFIKAGFYAQTIRPLKSGAKGQYITYTNFQGADVTIGGGIKFGADLSNRSWIKIDGLHFTDTNGSWIEFEPNGSYNQISNNEFEATGSSMSYTGLHVKERSDYNRIIGNSLTSKCQPKDLIMIQNSSYNLIEDNKFRYASHNALNLRGLGVSEYNVIRSNTFRNPYHSALGVWRSANYTLVEKNIISDSGSLCDDDGCPANICGSDKDQSADITQHAAIQLGSQYCIIRQNVLANNGRFTLVSYSDEKMSVENRIYQNTFYSNQIGWLTNANEGYPLSGNIAVNNIFEDHVEKTLSFTSKVASNDNLFINNNFNKSAVLTYKSAQGLDAIESKYSEWQGNNNLDPGFKNATSYNFSLRSNSPMIDTAKWLTTITSASGNGKSFFVADASYFSDGFGIIEGDNIQLENQTSTMVIQSINYQTNKIVVDRQVSWKKGDGLSLPYTGSAPDMGALEYGAVSSNPGTDMELQPPLLRVIN